MTLVEESSMPVVEWKMLPPPTGQKNVIRRVQEVKPPKIELVMLENFDLKKLEDTFRIASFERRTLSPHITKIIQSILDNKFFSPFISAIRLPYGKFGVFDSQHRLHALLEAREHGVRYYDIYVAVYRDQDLAELYESMNLGKPLTVLDHCKAWDDGRKYFFNHLRELLLHYPDTRKLSFVEMLYCHTWYIMKQYTGGLVKARNSLKKIRKEDVERMITFLEVVYQEIPDKEKTWMRGAVVFRNLYRVFREKNLDGGYFEKLIEKVRNNPQISSAASSRDKAAYETILQIMGQLADSL